jgi:1-deoxy-D-xylulose-5-phosphate reductoisomerase
LPAALNAANEEAVRAFLDHQIGLTDIPQVIETVMDQHTNQPASSIEIVLQADKMARLSAISTIEKLANRTVILSEKSV